MVVLLRTVRVSLPALILATSIIPTLAAAADWNQWRGPARDGYAHGSPALIEELPDGGLKPLWMSEEDVPGGGGWSSPIVADGRVYVYTHKQSRRNGVTLPEEKYPPLEEAERAKLSKEELEKYEDLRREEQFERRKKRYRFDDVIHCLDAKSGALRWRHVRESGPTRWRQSSTPAAVDGKVYILGADRAMVCLDAAAGEKIWVEPLPFEPETDEPMVSSVAIAEGVAVVSAGRLIGYDAETGKVLWQADEEATAERYSSPVVWRFGDRELIIAGAGRDTLCVDPKTGSERWRVDSYAGRATPTVVGDRLITYGSSRKGGIRCYAITPSAADLLWTYRGVADAGSSPVVVGDHVFAQGDRRLVCVDLKRGRVQWRTTLTVSNPRYTSLIAADDKVFFAVDGLLCFAATGDEYQPLIQAQIDEEGLLASDEYYRKLLGMDELERTAEGQQKAVRLWRKKLGANSPQTCVTPAVADGKLFLRTRSRIICYDLAASR